MVSDRSQWSWRTMLQALVEALETSNTWYPFHHVSSGFGLLFFHFHANFTASSMMISQIYST